MGYLCVKQLSLGSTTFHPGDAIPDGVVLADRAGKLKRNGYIAEMGKASGKLRNGDRVPERTEASFTQEQVEKMVAEAVDEAVNNTVREMEQKQKELQEAEGVFQGEGFLPEGTVIIPVKGDSAGDDEQQTAVPATPEEIIQVFSIMQLNVEDGARAIADVKSENVLILLHAADSRKTIKDAAQKQADNIFSTSGNSNESMDGNATAGTNTEGVDT